MKPQLDLERASIRPHISGSARHVLLIFELKLTQAWTRHIYGKCAFLNSSASCYISQAPFSAFQWPVTEICEYKSRKKYHQVLLKLFSSRTGIEVWFQKACPYSRIRTQCVTNVSVHWLDSRVSYGSKKCMKENDYCKRDKNAIWKSENELFWKQKSYLKTCFYNHRNTVDFRKNI